MSFDVIAIQIVAFIFALSFHEAAHAWAADRLGDPTARLNGRLTMNPIPHIDPFMTLLFPAMLIFMGSPVVFGAAKPVPVDTQNLADPKRDHCWIAAAGPISNVILAAASIFGIWILRATAVPGGIFEPSTGSLLQPIGALLWFSVVINVVLAVFNMIPLHPLDGSWILSAFLEGPAAEAYASLRPYGFMILIALLFLGVFDAILGPFLQLVRMLAFL